MSSLVHTLFTLTQIALDSSAESAKRIYIPLVEAEFEDSFSAMRRLHDVWDLLMYSGQSSSIRGRMCYYAAVRKFEE